MKIKTAHIFLILSVVFSHAFSPSVAQRDKKKKGEAAAQSNSAGTREAEFFFTEAEKFYILEDYAKALLYFERVAEMQPQNATVHYKIAEVLSKSQKDEDVMKAAQHIEMALKLERKNKYFYLLASNIYSSVGQFEKAANVMEALMKEVKGTEDYLFELAALYLYGNKPEDAMRIYNQAEAVLGINEVSSLQKQRIWMDLGKPNEAIAEGERLVETFPEEERYLLALAEIVAQQGNRTKGIALIENFLNENPDAGSAKMLLAGLYRDDGQEEKSRELVLGVMDDPQVDINNKILMLGTYSAVLTQNKEKKITDTNLQNFVTQLFQKLEANYPNEANVHLLGGDLYMTLDRNRDAELQYLKAIRNGSSNLEAWQNLLFLEIQSNSFDSLIVHSDEALELFPNQGMMYYFNGYGHLRKRHYQQAAMSLEQSKKLSSANPQLILEINSMLGDAYEGSREYAKSEKAYDEVLVANPNNDLVLNNYSYYLALRKQNLEKAEKMSTQLVKNHPDNISYLDTHAWVLFMREKYKEARKVIEKAIQTGKATAIHFEHYGDILFQLGEVDQAVEQWQKAKSMGGDNAVINKKIANRRIL